MPVADNKAAKDGANRRLGLLLVLVAVGMFGFGYLLVPLYDVFCELVGIDRGAAEPATALVMMQPDLSRTVKVEFLTSVNGGGWTFAPKDRVMQVHPGKMYHATFVAQNLRSSSVVGQAIFSTAPVEAGQYIRKTECFCFSPQPFMANEKQLMPMVFTIDPAMPDYIKTVTLAYTMYTITDG